MMSGLRTLLIPLLLLCCTPRERPVISGEAMSFFFTGALGLSNGVAGSLPMMLAPSKVPSSLRETAGNMMTLSYNVGLILGSLLAYMFEAILGQPIDIHCPEFPFAPPNNKTTALPHTIPSTTAMTTVAPLPTRVITTVASYLAGVLATSTSTTTMASVPALAGNFSILVNSTTTMLVNASNSNTAYEIGHYYNTYPGGPL